MLLTLGILLWAAAHLFVALAPDARQQMIGKLGLGPYKGLFSLCVLGALALIVLGWQSFPPTSLYIPPAPLRHVTMLLMPLALILFFAARMPTDIKQVIRHPQLTGVKLWAVAHLLANGETRSVILFTGLLAWAVMEVIFINKRDPQWVKPPRQGALKTGLQIVIALVITGGVIFGHQWIAGVPLISR